MRPILTMVLCVVLLGCAGGAEEARNLNRQNLHAGELIETRATDPEVKQAGKDVKLNSTVIEKIQGPPKEDKSYSEKESAEARAKGESVSGGFWVGLGGIAVTIASLAWAFLKTTALKHAATAIETLVTSGQKVKEKAAAGTLTPEDVTETYKAAVELAPAPVKAKIEETLVRVKKKLNGGTEAPQPAGPTV